ncbi:hypothetical protein M0805_005279 [Coniferiporia weirii]|nr:hypothetical protein M0805_005279 [Coniferiporia weirii]
MALTTRLPSTKVEPFYGFVETTGDALRLIQAARQGIIPRITRRLNDLERRAMIRSGSIFIFSDDESGIKRWTEGLSWSASRIVGNFLVYREVTDRANARSPPESRRASKRRGNTSELTTTELAEQKLSKSLVGCLSDNNGRFKLNGLIKKTITIGVEGSDHHLIAYYSQEDVRLGKLLPLSSRADIMALDIPPELLESTKFRIPPVTENGLDGRPRYICDADEGLGESPRQTSLPFPSISQSVIPCQRAPLIRPRPAHTQKTHIEESSTPVIYSMPGYHEKCRSSESPSATSSVSDNSSSWLAASLGFVQPSQTNQSYTAGPNGGQRNDKKLTIHPPLPFPAGYFTPYSALSIAHDSIGFLSAWNGDFGIGAGSTFALVSPSESPASSFAYHRDYPVLSLSTLTQSHSSQHTSTSHSSLPATPTQPRQSQRFASLPSRYQLKDTSIGCLSATPLCPSPQTGETLLSLPDSTLTSVDDMLHLASVWS